MNLKNLSPSHVEVSAHSMLKYAVCSSSIIIWISGSVQFLFVKSSVFTQCKCNMMSTLFAGSAWLSKWWNYSVHLLYSNVFERSHAQSQPQGKRGIRNATVPPPCLFLYEGFKDRQAEDYLRSDFVETPVALSLRILCWQDFSLIDLPKYSKYSYSCCLSTFIVTLPPEI